MRPRRRYVDEAIARIRVAPASKRADLAILERTTHRARGAGGWPRSQVDRVFDLLATIARTPSRTEDERISALYGLRGFFEGRGARAMLAVLGDTNAPPHVRAEASDGLGYLGRDVVARSSPGLAGAAELLAAAARDPSPDVRYWALYAIGALDLRTLRDVVAAHVDDTGTTRGGHSVAKEASDVLAVLDGGPWPES